MKGWVGWLLHVAAIVATIVIAFKYGHDAGYRVGERHAEERAEISRQHVNSLMRYVGICSWVKVMAAKIECKNEYKPGEP